jgi:hypothetical protein
VGQEKPRLPHVFPLLRQAWASDCARFRSAAIIDRLRRAANSPCKIAIEQFETARLGRLGAILHRSDDAGFTLAIFDTPGVDSEAAQVVAGAANLCLFPARPTVLDIEAAANTFRAAYFGDRRAAFILNQCPPTPRSARATDAAQKLSQLGVLAEPMIAARIDTDALAAMLIAGLLTSNPKKAATNGCQTLPEDAKLKLLERYPGVFPSMRIVRVKVTSPTQPDLTFGLHHRDGALEANRPGAKQILTVSALCGCGERLG